MSEQVVGRIEFGPLVKDLRKDFPHDPRLSGSPEMELRWKAARGIEQLEKELSEALTKLDKYRKFVAAYDEWIKGGDWSEEGRVKTNSAATSLAYAREALSDE